MTDRNDVVDLLCLGMFQDGLRDYPRTYMVVDQSGSMDMWIARIVANIIHPENMIVWKEDSRTGQADIVSPVELDIVATDTDKLLAVMKAIRMAQAEIARLEEAHHEQ